MSDFTNDMRYPKRGAVQFDTKDRIDILISKTGDTRSMNIVYSDPETGEILQTSEGGGGVQTLATNIASLELVISSES